MPHGRLNPKMLEGVQQNSKSRLLPYLGKVSWLRDGHTVLGIKAE